MLILRWFESYWKLLCWRRTTLPKGVAKHVGTTWVPRNGPAASIVMGKQKTRLIFPLERRNYIKLRKCNVANTRCTAGYASKETAGFAAKVLFHVQAVEPYLTLCSRYHLTFMAPPTFLTKGANIPTIT